MGSCVTREDHKREIRDILEEELRKPNRKKLVLVGTSSSGKSTILKQLQSHYGKPLSDYDRSLYSNNLHQNLIESFRTLVYECEKVGEIPGKTKYVEELSDILIYLNWHDDLSSLILEYVGATASVEIIKECEYDASVTPQLIYHIKELWEDTAIQHLFLKRNTFHLPYDTEYLMNRIDAFVQPNYIPTLEDIVHCRRISGGILEVELTVNGEAYSLFDVGGMKNERKKWMYCFEDLTAVIFVASLADYDEILYEDETINKMEDTLYCFGQLITLNFLERTRFILILNKTDRFREKIQYSSFSSCPSFSDYKGSDPPEDFDTALEYVKNKFLSIVTEHKNSHIVSSDHTGVYPFVMCAIDSDDTIKVFGDVVDELAT